MIEYQSIPSSPKALSEPIKSGLIMQNSILPSKFVWSDSYVILTDQKEEFHIVPEGKEFDDNNLFMYSSPALSKVILNKINKLINTYKNKTCNYTVEFIDNIWYVLFFEEKSNDQYLKELRQYNKLKNRKQ